jgi:hypothetical protein
MRASWVFMLYLVRWLNTASPSNLKYFLSKLLALAQPSEGDTSALLYISDLIISHAPAKVPEIIIRYMSVLTTSRYSTTIKIYAVDLLIELALFSGDEDVKRVLSAVADLLSQIDEVTIRDRIYMSIHRATKNLSYQHPILDLLLTKGKANLLSSITMKRYHAFTVLRYFSSKWTKEDRLYFSCLLLADPDTSVLITNFRYKI